MEENFIIENERYAIQNPLKFLKKIATGKKKFIILAVLYAVGFIVSLIITFETNNKNIKKYDEAMDVYTDKYIYSDELKEKYETFEDYLASIRAFDDKVEIYDEYVEERNRLYNDYRSIYHKEYSLDGKSHKVYKYNSFAAYLKANKKDYLTFSAYLKSTYENSIVAEEKATYNASSALKKKYKTFDKYFDEKYNSSKYTKHTLLYGINTEARNKEITSNILSSVLIPLVGIIGFVVAVVVLVCVGGFFLRQILNFRLVVTDKRIVLCVRDKKWNRAVLPVNSITSAGTMFFKGIVIKTPSDHIRRFGIKNRDEIFYYINELIVASQPELECLFTTADPEGEEAENEENSERGTENEKNI